MSYKATEQYKKLQNMPISKMFYRGDGWPGKNCLISSDGNKIEYVHNGSLFDSKIRDAEAARITLQSRQK